MVYKTYLDKNMFYILLFFEGNNMNIAICDDIKSCQEDIEKHVKLYFNDNKIPLNIFKFDKTDSLLKSKIIFDIVFLDVELGEENGIEAGKQLRLKNERLIIFVVTAYNRYLDDAFDLRAFRFLTKPIQAERLYSALDSAIELLDNTFVTFIEAKTNKRIKISVREIIFIEIVNRKTKITTEKDVFLSNEKISYWKDRLSASYFAVPHSSFVVNMNYSAEYKRTELKLKCKDKVYVIPISARNQSKFKKAYFNFQSRN